MRLITKSALILKLPMIDLATAARFLEANKASLKSVPKISVLSAVRASSVILFSSFNYVYLNIKFLAKNLKAEINICVKQCDDEEKPGKVDVFDNCADPGDP